MDRIKIDLLGETSLINVSKGARVCWDSSDKADSKKNVLGVNDYNLIDRVGFQNHHESVLEHKVFNFMITGYSRTLNAELTRHRIASYSVESSRYVLNKKLKVAKSFLEDEESVWEYCVKTKDETTNKVIVQQLENLRLLVQSKTSSNDCYKYAMPEAFRTKAMFTINLRSLKNFLELRTSHRALFEIRRVANLIWLKLLEESTDSARLLFPCLNSPIKIFKPNKRLVYIPGIEVIEDELNKLESTIISKLCKELEVDREIISIEPVKLLKRLETNNKVKNYKEIGTGLLIKHKSKNVKGNNRYKTIFVAFDTEL